MKRWIAQGLKALGVVQITVLCSATALAQQRIQPIFIEEWFKDRFVYALLVGVVIGIVYAKVGLRGVLPSPGKPDNKAARFRFIVWALILTLLLCVALVLDTTYVYQFGKRYYAFPETLTQVLLTRYSIVLVLFALAAYYVTAATMTRLSGRHYRYALFPR